jgi:purine-cytosine permease-like protein
MHRPNPPSIDPGVVAFLWALLLGLFVYFGLKAVGTSGATSIVLALLAFAAIWLFVRLRGEDEARP